jgi:hypothetical protein
MPQAASTNPADAYRRCARRLRGRLDGNPAGLYRSLRELSDGYDKQYPNVSRRTISFAPPRPADDFAAKILRRIRNGVLSYSDRLHLLAVAEELGISRFDANLIIAAVQHRAQAKASPEARTSRFRLPGFESVIAFAAVQASILFLVWVIFVH